ncbi:hypothetical protein SUGI_0112100 [Cryptomeria japonica]|nr:hypothetical protein SUGI_0112100 [Cryptomeria japonica]
MSTPFANSTAIATSMVLYTSSLAMRQWLFRTSYLDDFIQPAGWSEGAGNFALDTLYYGEYMNIGLSAPTANRVKWRGYHAIKTSFDES